MRFYRNKFPKVDELVIGIPTKIDDMGVNVKLVEYNDQRAFIALREVSERRFRSIKKVIKIGRVYPLLVVAVDEEKEYVDLSNKYITDRDSAIEHYNKYKHVISVFKQFLYRLGKKLERELGEEEALEYAEKVVWRFDRKEAYDQFSKIRIDLDRVDQFDLSEEERELLKEAIIKMFKKPVYTVQARFNMFVIGTAGVDRIKTILAYADSCSRDGVEMQITLLTTPCYQIQVVGENEKLAVCVIREALNIVERMIADERGSYKLLRFTSTNSLITDHVDVDRLESIPEGSEGEEDSEDGE